MPATRSEVLAAANWYKKIVASLAHSRGDLWEELKSVCHYVEDHMIEGWPANDTPRTDLEDSILLPEGAFEVPDDFVMVDLYDVMEAVAALRVLRDTYFNDDSKLYEIYSAMGRLANFRAPAYPLNHAVDTHQHHSALLFFAYLYRRYGIFAAVMLVARSNQSHHFHANPTLLEAATQWATLYAFHRMQSKAQRTSDEAASADGHDSYIQQLASGSVRAFSEVQIAIGAEQNVTHWYPDARQLYRDGKVLGQQSFVDSKLWSEYDGKEAKTGGATTAEELKHHVFKRFDSDTGRQLAYIGQYNVRQALLAPVSAVTGLRTDAGKFHGACLCLQHGSGDTPLLHDFARTQVGLIRAWKVGSTLNDVMEAYFAFAYGTQLKWARDSIGVVSDGKIQQGFSLIAAKLKHLTVRDFRGHSPMPIPGHTHPVTNLFDREQWPNFY